MRTMFFDFSVNLCQADVHKDKLLIQNFEDHMVPTRSGWV